MPELTQLRARVERLEGALRQYANEKNWDCGYDPYLYTYFDPNRESPWEVAATALKGDE